MILTFLKRDSQIFKAKWRHYFPSWLFFFLILFVMNMVQFDQSTVFFILFFVVVLTLKDTFVVDQDHGLFNMLISEKTFLPYYVFSKIISSILYVLLPLLAAIQIFAPGFDLWLPGIIMTGVSIMGASMQTTKNMSWLLHLMLLPFMIPIFLLLDMHLSNRIDGHTMFLIFSGLALIYLPLSILFSTLCLKRGD